jgi:hypothetical protein
MAISQNFPEEGPTLNLNFAGSKVLDPRITFSRSSVGTYMDANGLVVTAAADSPRFDHRYVNGEVESLGLLVEERRTNLLTNSEDVTATGWGKYYGGTASDPVITANYGIAPDGTQTADRVQLDKGAGTTTTDNTNIYNNSYSTVASQPYAQSVWLKTTDGSTKSVRFSFSGESAEIKTVTGTWQRFVNKTASASDTVRHFRLSLRGSLGTSDSADLLVWGAQVEDGYFETSYIPTSGSTVTRNHDRAYYENVDQTDWFSKTEGTVVFEHTDVPYNSSTSTGWPAVGFGETAGGGSNPSIQYFITKDYGAAQYLVRITPGTDSANINVSGTGSAAAASKVGFVYKEDDYALVRNGSLVGTDSSGAVPAAYMLILGMNGITNTDRNWNAHLKNLQYYPTRLSNTVLQNLTK